MTDCKSFEEVKTRFGEKTRYYGQTFLDSCARRPLDSDCRVEGFETKDGWYIRLYVCTEQLTASYITYGSNESIIVNGAFRDSYDNREILKLPEILFATIIPMMRRWIQLARDIDNLLGDLAMRLLIRRLGEYQADNLKYTFDSSGLLCIPGFEEPVSVEKGVPVIAEALRKAPHCVTRGPVEVTNILYIYYPETNSRCPREDVIEHFRKVFSQGLYESGSVEDYRKDRSTFRRRIGWAGAHQCEGKGCGTPQSTFRDYHLIPNGVATYFTTNWLACHYLKEHWYSPVCQVDRAYQEHKMAVLLS